MQEQDVFKLIEQLQGEVDRLGLAYYHWKAIHNLGSTHGFDTIKIHSGFWATSLYSMQNTYVLGLAKLFDKSKSAFNLDRVVEACRTSRGYFGTTHMAARKLAEVNSCDPGAWTQADADSFASSAFIPTEADFETLQSLCDRSREIVQTKIVPIRHRIAAHAKMGITKEEQQALYGAVDTDSVESVINDAFTVGQSLWSCWINGQAFKTQADVFRPHPTLESDLLNLMERASKP